MKAILIGAALLAGTLCGMAPAQTPPAALAAPEQARLTAAREVIDILMSPATREKMVQGMLAPMLANLRQGMTRDPQFAAAIKANPKLGTLFGQFMDRQQQQTVTQMRTALPGMAEAMTRAYARRFDMGQLGEMKTFFRTPTGRAYTAVSYTIMADPDVAAWQRDLMTGSMSRVQADVAAFVKEAAALEGKKP